MANDKIVVEEIGRSYKIPTKGFDPEKGLTTTGNYLGISILRADRTGILHEDLLDMMIMDLKVKNLDVPSIETTQAISHLQSALISMQKRKLDRIDRKVLHTNET